jgi:hypothetical protein
MANRAKDKTGEKYGRLTVIEPIGIGKDRSMWFKCRCDCGNEIELSAARLRKSKYGTKSCGCLNDDKYKSLTRSMAISKRLKKYNEYIFMPDYIIGITARGEKFYFDKDDYEKIKKYRWQKNKAGYIAANVSIIGNNGNRANISLHRLVMNSPKEQDIDHINHDATNNRKINLRVCTHQQNGFNQRARGYYYDKKIKRWRVTIGLNYKTIHIGCFKTETEAKIAREKAAIQYYGEYRYQKTAGGLALSQT